MENFVHLHTKDNIVIALNNLAAGDLIKVNGKEIKLKSAIDFGHKIAIMPIRKKDKILKYGLSIGSATQGIAIGEHVHSHNLQTDYIIDQQKQEH